MMQTLKKMFGFVDAAIDKKIKIAHEVNRCSHDGLRVAMEKIGKDLESKDERKSLG